MLKRALLILLFLSPFAHAQTAQQLLLFGSPCNTPTVSAGLVGYWPLNGNTIDCAQGNNGIAANSPTYGAGKIAQAISLNGTNQCVSIPTSAITYSPTSTFTFMAWAKAAGNQPTGTGNRQSIFSAVVPANTFEANIGLPYFGNNKWSIEVGKSTVTSQQLSATTTQTPGTWYHITGLFMNGSMELRVNAISQGTLAYNATIMGAATSSGNAIGSEPNAATCTSGGTFFFPGLIDTVLVYNRYVSQAEDAAIVAAGNAGRAMLERWRRTRLVEFAVSDTVRSLQILDRETRLALNDYPTLRSLMRTDDLPILTAEHLH